MRKYKLCFILCFSFFILSACSDELNISAKDSITAEYGEELDNNDLYDESDSDSDIVVDEIKQFDKLQLGEQEVIVTFKKGSRTETVKIKVTVADTRAPKITLKKDSIEIEEGDAFDPASNIESVKDPIDGDITKSDDTTIVKDGYYITNDVNIDSAGEYEVKITAFDRNQNKAESSYKVVVKAKEKVVQSPPPQQPSQNSSQPQTQTPSSNQGSQSSGGGTSNVPSQPITGEVYIAGSGNGTKYHRSPNCSNMNNPIGIPLNDAIARGYTACKKCYWVGKFIIKGSHRGSFLYHNQESPYRKYTEKFLKMNENE